MKKLLILFICLVQFIIISAQDTVIIHMDASYELTTEDSAKVVRTAIISNGYYYITDRNMDNKVINYCEYKSINPWIEDGKAQHYSKPDVIYSKGEYTDGQITGKWIYYTDSSIDTVDYSSSDVFYDNQECLDSNKKKSRKESVQAEKHINSLKIFISENFQLPARTKTISEYFSCDLSIILDVDGRIKCPEVNNSIENDDLDSELLRILALYKSSDSITEPLLLNFDIRYDKKFSKGEVFVIVDNMPTFKGGDMNKFRLWVSKNLIYPEIAIKNGIQGNVFVQFTVDAEGLVDDIEVVRSVDPVLDAEAIRVIKSSPQWKPGKHDGKPVRVQFTFPVIFTLQ